VLDAGLALARPGARLRLLHVVEPALHASGFETPAVYLDQVLPAVRREGQAVLDRAAARLHRAGLVFDMRLVDDRCVSAAVLDEARAFRADVIVMGTHGRRGLARLATGSDAEAVLRAADVPVLAVRTAGEGQARAAAAVATSR
jgi:nucleotide-binding universal stress UspA family protein